MNNKIKAWVLATRPKTLPAAMAPVLCASALTFSMGLFKWEPTFYCFVFALLCQIASNFINDYFDAHSGLDGDDRQGPKRAVASGWITEKTMLKATIITLVIAVLIGLNLLRFGGMQLLWVGGACVLGCCLYSVGPYPLSRYGMGDIFVLVFFGWVPVLFTVFVQSKSFPNQAWQLGTAIGLLSINILIANNYRDYESDKRAGKYTTIVLFGKRFGKWFYFSTGMMAELIMLCFFAKRGTLLGGLPMLIYLFFHLRTWKKMIRIKEGRKLCEILSESSVNLLIFSGLFILLVLSNRATA